MPASLTSDAQYRERFNREADIAASLWHPHIVGLHDRGEYEGQLWIAMDYVDGTDAARHVRERHPAESRYVKRSRSSPPSPRRSTTPTSATCCTAT